MKDRQDQGRVVQHGKNFPPIAQADFLELSIAVGKVKSRQMRKVALARFFIVLKPHHEIPVSVLFAKLINLFVHGVEDHGRPSQFRILPVRDLTTARPSGSGRGVKNHGKSGRNWAMESVFNKVLEFFREFGRECCHGIDRVGQAG